MKDALLTVAVLLGILIASAAVTQWATRAMYNRCPSCGALNAKRRTQCRVCTNNLE